MSILDDCHEDGYAMHDICVVCGHTFCREGGYWAIGGILVCSPACMQSMEDDYYDDVEEED